jgi:hypothetical protein
MWRIVLPLRPSILLSSILGEEREDKGESPSQYVYNFIVVEVPNNIQVLQLLILASSITPWSWLNIPTIR